MLPKFFKAMKSHDPSDRRTVFKSYHTTTNPHKSSRPVAKMAHSPNQDDVQTSNIQPSEKAVDVVGIHSFEGFSDEAETMDEETHEDKQFALVPSHDQLSVSHEYASGDNDQLHKESITMPESTKSIESDAVPSQDKEPASDVLCNLHGISENPTEMHSRCANDLDMADQPIRSAESSNNLENTSDNPNLRQYQPSTKQLLLLDRKCKSPLPAGTGWSIPVTWPPPKPVAGTPPVRSDVLPPENSPLHIQLQAYALRWGTWATTIKDDERRGEMLKWVTEKMRAAWEIAIKEGYYPLPNISISQVDHDKSESDGQTKPRGRKRAPSPSRQTVPFAHEGKDPLAITMGELTAAGVALETVNDRVARRDIEDGELLLDEVLTNLNQDRIEIKDWSRSSFPQMYGRNLLMYCLYVVQESRSEIHKLEKLLPTFKKETQKKNTRNRIDTYQERVIQHLALAIELQLARPDNADIATDIQTDVAVVEAIQEISDSSIVESGESDSSSDDEVDRLPDGVIQEIAYEVIGAKDAAALENVYASRDLQSQDFQLTTSDEESDSRVESLKRMLGKIHCFFARITDLRDLMSKTDPPSEKVKIWHDIRLNQEKIEIVRKQVRDVLGHPTETHPPITSADSQSTSNLPTGYHTIAFESQNSSSLSQQQFSGQKDIKTDAAAPSKFIQPPADPEVYEENTAINSQQSQSTAQHQSSIMQIHSPIPLQNQSVTQPQSSLPQVKKPVAEEKTSHTEQTTRESTAKAVYIDQVYRPWLNQLLRDRGIPPIHGRLSTWQHLKDILLQLGFGTAKRNEVLKNFKTGFDKFLVTYGSSCTQGTVDQGKNVAPVTEAVTSPEPQVVIPQTQSILSRPHPGTSQPQQTFQTSPGIAPFALGKPTDVEVMAAIPPQGIHGTMLLHKFVARYGGNPRPLVAQVQRVAVIGSGNMVYPRNNGQRPAQQPTMVQSPSAFSAYGQGFTYPQASARAAHMNQGPLHTLPASSRPIQHLQASASMNATVKDTTNLPQSPQQVVKLKVNPNSTPVASASGPPLESDEGEFSTKEVSSDRGFSFRFLPTSTMEQRENMDDDVENYITGTIKSRKKRPYGQYIQLPDPSNSSTGPIVHGFWDLDSKGTRRTDVNWFYKGEDMPTDGVPNISTSSKTPRTQEDAASKDGQVTAQTKPKIRLNVNANHQQNAQAAAPISSVYTAYGTNPHLLKAMSKKGTKRPSGGEETTKARKKRRTVSDDDDEYDPSRDY